MVELEGYVMTGQLGTWACVVVANHYHRAEFNTEQKAFTDGKRIPNRIFRV